MILEKKRAIKSISAFLNDTSSVFFLFLGIPVPVLTGIYLHMQMFSYLSNVKIEEVAVENGLDTTRNNGNDIVEGLSVVSVKVT
jgi:hypothetical protein